LPDQSVTVELVPGPKQTCHTETVKRLRIEYPTRRWPARRFTGRRTSASAADAFVEVSVGLSRSNGDLADLVGARPTCHRLRRLAVGQPGEFRRPFASLGDKLRHHSQQLLVFRRHGYRP
jgi:hypothetical protein